jgi:hypothetical protein
MAMTECRECKGAVSSTAKTCPHCGVSRPTLTEGEVKAQAAASIAYNVGCLILIGLFVFFALALIVFTAF